MVVEIENNPFFTNLTNNFVPGFDISTMKSPVMISYVWRHQGKASSSHGPVDITLGSAWKTPTLRRDEDNAHVIFALPSVSQMETISLPIDRDAYVEAQAFSRHETRISAVSQWVRADGGGFTSGCGPVIDLPLAI